MYQDIIDGKYKSKLPYPSKPKKPNTSVNVEKATDADIAAVRKAIADFEEAEKAYKKAVDAYRAEESRLADAFKTDLLLRFNVTNNPKADLCFQKSWGRGHSDGLTEVFDVFEDLVELIK